MRPTCNILMLLSTIVLMSSGDVHGQYFQRTFGWGPFNTAAGCAFQPDGHYGLLGSFSSSTSNQTDFVLMQVDTNGTFEWAKAYGTAGIDNATGITALPDSGYLLVGFSNGFSSNNDYDGYVVRTDKYGDSLWTIHPGTSDWDFANDVLLLSDGNYLIAGSTEFASSGVTSGWLQVISPGGQSLNSKVFPDASNRISFSGAKQANDSVIYVSGYKSPIGDTSHNPIIFRLRYPSLDTTWTFTGDTAMGDGEFVGIAITADHCPVACGYTIDSGRIDKDILLAKLDTSGNRQWQRIISSPGTEYLTAVVTQGDSIVCSGITDQYGGGREDFYVIRFRPNGTFLRGRTFGDSETDIAYDVTNTVNKRITAFGTTRSYGPGIISMMIVSCDDSMNLTPPMVVGTEVPDPIIGSLVLFPNPGRNILHVAGDVSDSFYGFVVEILDVHGKTYAKSSIDNRSIDITTIPAGIFLVRIFSPEGAVSTYRIMKVE